MSERWLRRFAIVTGVLFLMFVSALQATEGPHYSKVTNALGFLWLAMTFALMVLAMLPRGGPDQ